MEELEVKETVSQQVTDGEAFDGRTIIAPERLIFRGDDENAFSREAGNALRGEAGNALRGEAGNALRGEAGNALRGEAGNALRGEAENVFGREAGNGDDESSDDEPRDEREDFIHPERLELRRKGEAKRLAIEAEFRKINALDPTVKSFDDLMLMENAEEFAEKVRKGYSLSDAFIITNGKKLSEKLKNSAVRAALLRLGTKQHLVSTSTGGGEAAVDVPAETYSLYKTLYPDITDREIKKHYKKHNK